MAESIDINEMKRILSGGEPLILLDVRRRADVEADPRRIPGAAWRDPEQIDTWVKQVPAGRRAVVYCVKGGSVSQSTADLMKKEGVEAVFLAGGLNAWIDTGESVEEID